MPVSEQDVKRWFDVVQKWGRANTPEACREISHCLLELSSFLSELLKSLEELAGNPPLILQRFPSVGKLLGQLYENCVVLSSEEIFQTIVKSSVVLAYSDCPSSSKELNITKRAQSWAQAKLRKASTPVQHSNLLQIGEFWNFTAQETSEILLDKLVSSLCHDLELMTSYTWDSHARDCHPQKTISGLCLRELSELCLPLITLPKATPLVEKILCCEKSLDLVSRTEEGSLHVTDSVSPVFLKTVASRMRLDQVPQLSYRAKVSLWKKYKPSFESEILDLAEISTVQRPYIDQSQLREIIALRELPRACVENPDFFSAAMSLLSAVFVQSEGSFQVSRLMSIFGEMCVETCITCNQQAFFKLCDLFPDSPQSLVTKLSFKPRDLGSQELIVQSVSRDLDEIRIQLSKSMWFSICQVLWCFPSWETEVLHLSLSTCNQQVLDECSNVLCWYHCPPLSDDHNNLKKSLGEMLQSLRLLKSKTQLQLADVECILSLSPDLPVTRTASLLGRLLMVFLSEAVGGHFVFGAVLRMLTPGFTMMERLSFTLDNLENSFLGRKPQIGASGELRKGRRSLAEEITHLLKNSQGEAIKRCGSALSDLDKPHQGQSNDSLGKDLLDRTEQFINVLQT